MPSRKDENGLSFREARFCDEYLVDCNGTQAAIRSGYSAHTAGQQACVLLKRINVKARLEQMKAEHLKKANITPEEIVAEIAKIALFNPANFLVVGEDGQLHAELGRMTRDDMAAIGTLEFENKVLGRVRRPKGRGTGGHSRAGAALTRSMVSKIKPWDKAGALALLGRHFNLFTPDNEPPPPPDPGKRQHVVQVFVNLLEQKAATIHVLQGGEQTGALSVVPGKPAAPVVPASRAATELVAARAPGLAGKLTRRR